MNNSTAGVTLFAGFISDLLAQYEAQRNSTARELFAMSSGVDLSDPTRPLPMELYNHMCAWIERKLGPANLRRSGERIGERAYEQMVAGGGLGSAPTPHDILEQLVLAAAFMIQDPEKRGWVLVESQEKRAVMRRTQTFHPVLQEGLLRSLVRKSGAIYPKVSYLRSVASGDPYDEYEITWT
jgi:hypothetical protein